MEHAHQHDNIQLLEPMHLSQLNICKSIFKHGILSNASDDARTAISKQLMAWKHPLDTRRKDNKRNGREKWFTGERWATPSVQVSVAPQVDRLPLRLLCS